MRKTFKYRLYPTKHQITLMNQTLELCRQVYNKTLDLRNTAWKERKESINLYTSQKILTGWKKETEELKLVHSQVLQNVQMRVDLAYKAFFRRVKQVGQKPGFPRFKGKGRYDSFTFPQFGTNGGYLRNKILRIGKVGDIKIILHRPIEGKTKTCTIKKTATGKWFAYLSVEVEPKPRPTNNKAIGIDVGIKSFATLSNGKQIENPKFFEREKKTLAKAQQKLSKAKMRTFDRKRKRRVVARIYERVTNKRTNFAHQLSRELVNKFGVIAFEKLDIKKMQQSETANRNLNRYISDAAWNQLIQFTSYKAEEAGRKVILVDPKNTSQRCSRCGLIVKKKLSERVHKCPTCGLKLDRDVNAAINILALGLQSIEPPKGS